MSTERPRKEPAFAALTIFAGLCSAIVAFFVLAAQQEHTTVRSIDRRIMMAFREMADSSNTVGPGWLDEVVRDVTALGGFTLLTLATFAACVSLSLLGQRRDAVLVALSVISGAILSSALKTYYDRPRPDVVAHVSQVFTKSFPSGHAMLSAVTYLTLGGLLARQQRRRSLKLFVVAAAVMIVIAIGISRIYLGVHWPSDVVAGWLAGAVWALLCWSVAHASRKLT